MNVETINYDGKTFRTIKNTKNGEVTQETIFHYKQEGNRVLAEYAGGGILVGHLIALVDEDGNLDMRYQHINDKNELMTGICKSRPEKQEDGRLRMHEEWEWTCKEHSKGWSIIEEIQDRD
ncbi:n-acetylglutamate synthase [Paenibacillus vini]|uniref:N-acetylglutamate synthase n=1 Tax=Paenibacillus vini TaxID=1476024 RepID=A0ABQ4MBD2_9BACL|nr:n-acetylglutamate synthase [Paenibacillus vini]GIP53287.1 hypothetical protein J42TS3_23220 [Paenibacillus vini]